MIIGMYCGQMIDGIVGSKRSRNKKVCEDRQSVKWERRGAVVVLCL